MYDYRTDLAVERTDLYKRANNLKGIEGIEVEEQVRDEKIKVTRVKVLDEKGEQAINKKRGVYITIDIQGMQIATEDEIQNASEQVTNEIKTLVEQKVQDKDEILIIGLGNIYVTPDALGPKVVNEIDITRHIVQFNPELLSPDVREVSAVSPGVLGTSGIETFEIIKGIVENTKPKLIIAIDALASKSLDRILSTIQISDTGIVPGAGVGNKRKEISMDTLGIPVIAVGVPTVVEAATIAADSIDLFTEKLGQMLNENIGGDEVKGAYNAFNQIKDEDKYSLIKDVLAPTDYNLVVTPKEVDDMIENMKDIIARGINFAVQK